MLARLNPADTAGRLEESKVIMGNWLSHLKYLAGSYPPVSLLILLSGRLLWWSCVWREAESFLGFFLEALKGSFEKLRAVVASAWA